MVRLRRRKCQSRILGDFVSLDLFFFAVRRHLIGCGSDWRGVAGLAWDRVDGAASAALIRVGLLGVVAVVGAGRLTLFFPAGLARVISPTPIFPRARFLLRSWQLRAAALPSCRRPALRASKGRLAHALFLSFRRFRQFRRGDINPEKRRYVLDLKNAARLRRGLRCR